MELTDDLTGDPADETVRFVFDGKPYAIDLSTKNADKFRKALAPFVAAARRDTASAPAKIAITSSSAASGELAAEAADLPSVAS